MSTAHLTIPVSEELLHNIAEQASRTGMPTEEWISEALRERVLLERRTQDFFQKRAAGASIAPLGKLLDKASGRDPIPGDEL